MRKLVVIACVFVALCFVAQADFFQELWARRAVATAVGPYTWATNDFVMTWAIPDTNAVTVPGRSGYTPNAQIYWTSNDTPLAVTAYNDADLTHSYAGASTNQIIITGDWPALYFNNGGNKTLITSVDSWGTGANWDTLSSSFYGCSALTICASPLPAMPNVTSLSSTFKSCSNLQTAPDFGALTNVTSLSSTFFGCSVMTNVSNVSTLTKVVSLSQTWYNCSALKSAPDVSALTKVTTMVNAWRGCSALTSSVQSILGDCLWITGQVTSVGSAFNGCSKLSGNGMPLVSAITNSPGYPTGYTITDCFDNCTNLTDWATIPTAWK